MDWVPVALIIFKITMLGTGMFFAIKWHYDQDKKTLRSAKLIAIGKISAVLSLSAVGLLLATFMLARTIGLDTGFP